MTTTIRPTSTLEESLLALTQGTLEDEQFMHSLLNSELFMPIHDEDKIGGLQRSQIAKPLTITSDEGYDILILFTAPERGKAFLANYPGYEGGLLAEASWILERVGSGVAISINPGLEIGIDLEPMLVEQLVATVKANAPQQPL
ncbi:SseB family protein [Ectothiorhodospiraceae bacterium BW-2]|nr:SseB family protein [Ectothiorhodospiraceae bacterium BW-2]